MLSSKGDDDSTEDHVDRGGEEGGRNEDENRLDAVGRHRLFVVMRYDSSSVSDGFNCATSVRNILHCVWDMANVQTPPIVNGIKYQALALCRRHR